VLKKPIEEVTNLQKQEVEKKRKWVKPELTLYGDMAALTQGRNCSGCKVKALGLGDDFSDNISTFNP
jgi:hypothetical protein